MRRGTSAALLLLAFSLAARAEPTTCRPTPGWLASDSFPGVPERSVAGRGEVLRGTVLSERGCRPLAGARIVVLSHNWKREGEENAPVAALHTGADGSFRLETDPPVAAANPHLHLIVSAPGHLTVQVNYYPFPEGIRSDYSFPEPLDEAPPPDQSRGRIRVVLAQR